MFNKFVASERREAEKFKKLVMLLAISVRFFPDSNCRPISLVIAHGRQARQYTRSGDGPDGGLTNAGKAGAVAMMSRARRLADDRTQIESGDRSASAEKEPERDFSEA